MFLVRIAQSLVAVLALSGCAYTPPPDTAIMPTSGAGTPLMSDDGAAGLAAYVLGNDSLANGHPGDTARAVAAIDYLGGRLYSNPHWITINSVTRLRVLTARQEDRGTFGIAPDASSQQVVDGMIAVASALEGQDQAAATRALPSRVFTLGPDRTIALLRNRPPLATARIAAQALNAEMNTPCVFSPICT